MVRPPSKSLDTSSNNSIANVSVSQSTKRSRKSTPIKKKPRAVKMYRIGNKHFVVPVSTLKNINMLRATTNFLMPRSSFGRVVHEIIMNLQMDKSDLRIQRLAIEALQTAAESYLVFLFEDANLCSIHAKRATLTCADMRLALMLRREI